MTGNPRTEPHDDAPRIARAEIRDRIREGAYDSAAVLEAVTHGISPERGPVASPAGAGAV